VAVDREGVPTGPSAHGVEVPLGLSPGAARRLLQAPGDVALQRLTDLAARLLSRAEPVRVQVSLLSDVQTVAAGTHLPADAVGSTGPLRDSLCTVTAESGGPLVVVDAPADVRVSMLPPVTSGAVGAYVGVPLRRGSAVVGALCAFTPQPRTWSQHDVAVLEELSGAVIAQLELRALSGEYAQDRARWDIALDAAGVGSFAWDLDTGRLDWDRRMRTLFGYAEDDDTPPLAEAFSRILDVDRPVLDAAIKRSVATCGDFHAEYRIALPGDGGPRWVVARGAALAGPDGRAATLLGTAHDVTEVRNAKDEAAQLLRTMSTGFAAIDRDWRITFLNEEGSRVVGYAPKELVGRTLWEAFPGLDESPFGPFYRRAMVADEPSQVEAYYEHLGGWFEVRATPSPGGGLLLYFLEVTGRHADRERAAAATARLELLAEVSAELAAAGLDVEGAVARLARVVAPRLADWCLVSLTSGDRVRDVGHWHSDPRLAGALDVYVHERLHSRTDLGAVQQARSSSEPVVITSGATESVLPMLDTDLARSSWRELRTESIVVVPLLARGSMTGVLTLCRGADRPPMGQEEIATAREVAVRAGLALENARLYSEQRGLAEGLQRSLLTTPPELDHCEIAVRYAPAAEAASVGGDWYDAFLQDDGATMLVIGDVMGHDTEAAAAMGQLRGLLRGIAWHSGDGPARVLAGLDAAMRGLQVTTTATAVVARLEQGPDDLAAGRARLRWSNAGHPPPIALHGDGTVELLAGADTDLLLGIDHTTPRNEQAVELGCGAAVLLYTDGLIERRGQDLDTGTGLLSAAAAELAHLPLEQLCDALLHRLLPADADDDVALVAVRLHRQDRPRPAEAGPNRVPPSVGDGATTT
jgi:PAS domain S-box-containing protein